MKELNAQGWVMGSSADRFGLREGVCAVCGVWGLFPAAGKPLCRRCVGVPQRVVGGKLP